MSNVMNSPIKVIHKFKNNNRRTQYNIYIFLGELVEDDIMNILNTISKKDLYETFNILSDQKYKKMVEKYGEYWYKYFFNKYHIKNQISSIIKNPNKRRTLEQKYGKQWFEKHFNTFKMKKTEYSFASNYYDSLLARKIRND
jgi:pyruvate dehydrogenase complex dehydrogenase (E1) component